MQAQHAVRQQLTVFTHACCFFYMACREWHQPPSVIEQNQAHVSGRQSCPPFFALGVSPRDLKRSSGRLESARRRRRRKQSQRPSERKRPTVGLGLVDKSRETHDALFRCDGLGLTQNQTGRAARAYPNHNLSLTGKMGRDRFRTRGPAAVSEALTDSSWTCICTRSSMRQQCRRRRRKRQSGRRRLGDVVIYVPVPPALSCVAGR